MLARNMSLNAGLLGAFAIVGTALVALTYDNTVERIAANERAALLRNLHQLVSPDSYDNDLFHDIIEVTDADWLGTPNPIKVYRARKQGEPVAAILAPIAPDGYSGTIKLLVAIHYDGQLAGVRVISHLETPGLGDGIDVERSDWILGFNGKSLDNPENTGWAVKRDGGQFDQFTGATITPRAVVKATHKALQYFQANKDKLFAQPPSNVDADIDTDIDREQ